MSKFIVIAELSIFNEYDVVANDKEDASKQVKDMLYNSFESTLWKSIDADSFDVQIIDLEEIKNA